MINGTITDVPGASNDPLFILHHAFVDYILEMWIRRHHGEFKPAPDDISAAKGHNYNDIIVPFLPIVRAHEMLVESTVLGWTYESLDGLDIEEPDSEIAHSQQVMNKPNDTFTHQVLHEDTQYRICMLNSKHLVFQIPLDCNELLFPNNLVLPRLLVPLSWYKCSKLFSKTEYDSSVVYTCSYNPALIQTDF